MISVNSCCSKTVYHIYTEKDDRGGNRLSYHKLSGLGTYKKQVTKEFRLMLRNVVWEDQLKKILPECLKTAVKHWISEQMINVTFSSFEVNELIRRDKLYIYILEKRICRE